MSAKPIRSSRLIAEKKEKNKIRLTDRYLGKKDLLAEWEAYPDVDPDYLRDLRRRVRGHHMDLAYRGVDGFSETNGE